MQRGSHGDKQEEGGRHAEADRAHPLRVGITCSWEEPCLAERRQSPGPLPPTAAMGPEAKGDAPCSWCGADRLCTALAHGEDFAL